MSTDVNALLCFCEGAHDVAFVRKIFRKILEYKRISVSFSELPVPLNNLFAQAVKKHGAKDLSLDMAHKFYLPDAILRKENSYVLLFNSEGKDQFEKVRTFLTDYLRLTEQSVVLSRGSKESISHSKYLFIYDADEDGIDHKISLVYDEYRKIEKYDFIVEDLMVSSKTLFGRFSKDKAVFIWGTCPNSGTLEDVVLPMMDNNEINKSIKEKTGNALKNIFNWEIDYDDTPVAKAANYKKALLTVAGQNNKPGKSLSVVLAESGLVTPEALRASKTVKEFVDFLNVFLEQENVKG
jgi:hypothetical protein